MPDDAPVCASCGGPLAPGDRFCGSCGTPVAAAATPATPAATATPTTPVEPPAPRALDLPDASVRTPDLVSTSIPKAAPAFPALNRRLVITVAAVVGVIVVVGGGIALGVGIGAANRDASVDTSTGSSEVVSDEADAPDDTLESETVAETTAPSSTPTAASEAPVEFTSKSGNIACRMATDGVVCHQGEHTYAKPSQACTSGPKGVTIGLNQSGITWPCLGGAISTSYILPYDTIVTAHGYDCIITYATGVTCTNQDLYGFQMEYDLGIKAVQY